MTVVWQMVKMFCDRELRINGIVAGLIIVTLREKHQYIVDNSGKYAI
jgi:hypothetical protein